MRMSRSQSLSLHCSLGNALLCQRLHRRHLFAQLVHLSALLLCLRLRLSNLLAQLVCLGNALLCRRLRHRHSFAQLVHLSALLLCPQTRLLQELHRVRLALLRLLGGLLCSRRSLSRLLCRRLRHRHPFAQLVHLSALLLCPQTRLLQELHRVRLALLRLLGGLLCSRRSLSRLLCRRLRHRHSFAQLGHLLAQLVCPQARLLQELHRVRLVLLRLLGLLLRSRPSLSQEPRRLLLLLELLAQLI